MYRVCDLFLVPIVYSADTTEDVPGQNDEHGVYYGPEHGPNRAQMGYAYAQPTSLEYEDTHLGRLSKRHKQAMKDLYYHLWKQTPPLHQALIGLERSSIQDMVATSFQQYFDLGGVKYDVCDFATGLLELRQTKPGSSHAGGMRAAWTSSPGDKDDRAAAVVAYISLEAIKGLQGCAEACPWLTQLTDEQIAGLKDHEFIATHVMLPAVHDFHTGITSNPRTSSELESVAKRLATAWIDVASVAFALVGQLTPPPLLITRKDVANDAGGEPTAIDKYMDGFFTTEENRAGEAGHGVRSKVAVKEAMTKLMLSCLPVTGQTEHVWKTCVAKVASALAAVVLLERLETADHNMDINHMLASATNETTFFGKFFQPMMQHTDYASLHDAIRAGDADVADRLPQNWGPCADYYFIRMFMERMLYYDALGFGRIAVKNVVWAIALGGDQRARDALYNASKLYINSQVDLCADRQSYDQDEHGEIFAYTKADVEKGTPLLSTAHVWDLLKWAANSHADCIRQEVKLVIRAYTRFTQAALCSAPHVINILAEKASALQLADGTEGPLRQEAMLNAMWLGSITRKDGVLQLVKTQKAVTEAMTQAQGTPLQIMQPLSPQQCQVLHKMMKDNPTPKYEKRPPPALRVHAKFNCDGYVFVSNLILYRYSWTRNTNVCLGPCVRLKKYRGI